MVGVVVARGVENQRKGDGTALAALRQSEALARERPEADDALPVWRDALAQFGVDPTQHPPAVARLFGRLRQGEALPAVNPAVDLANAVALRHGVSLGVHDLDAT